MVVGIFSGTNRGTRTQDNTNLAQMQRLDTLTILAWSASTSYTIAQCDITTVAIATKIVRSLIETITT